MNAIEFKTRLASGTYQSPPDAPAYLAAANSFGIAAGNQQGGHSHCHSIERL
jgi:hypothetical protein